MAIKQKETEQKSKLVEVLTTEYRWENLLLGVLAVISASLALMIITNNPLLTINENAPIIGSRTNGLIFAWVLFSISVFGLFLVVYPFFLPAIPEIKKITWPSKKKFIDHSVRVFIFLVFFALIIFAYDVIIQLLIEAGIL